MERCGVACLQGGICAARVVICWPENMHVADKPCGEGAILQRYMRNERLFIPQLFPLPVVVGCGPAFFGAVYLVWVGALCGELCAAMFAIPIFSHEWGLPPFLGSGTTALVAAVYLPYCTNKLLAAVGT